MLCCGMSSGPAHGGAEALVACCAVLCCAGPQATAGLAPSQRARRSVCCRRAAVRGLLQAQATDPGACRHQPYLRVWPADALGLTA